MNFKINAPIMKNSIFPRLIRYRQLKWVVKTLRAYL